MAEFKWPELDQRSVIGSRLKRVDGPEKVAGKAKYSFDQNPKGLLFATMVRSPYAHCKVTKIDITAAQKMPGVKAVMVVQKEGTEIHWAGDEIVGIAAVSEGVAEDAVRAVKVEYSPLPHLVLDAPEPKSNEVAEDTGPLSEDDIWDALSNQVPANQLIPRLKSDGITFKPEESDLKEFKEEGAPDALVDAIRTAPQHLDVKPKPKSPYKRAGEKVQGDPETAFKEAEVVSEGYYGASVITHCCLEPHGAVMTWGKDGKVEARISTQNVSGMAGQLAGPLGIPATDIHQHQDHVGGGFGSKFSPDRWAVVAAQLSKMAGGAPVKMFNDRRSELEVAGARPSAFAKIRIAAKKDGTITGWESNSWGTGGPGGGGAPPLPYVFDIPHQRKQHIAVATNIGPARAWRAPAHPQAAALTMCAIDDAAAKVGMDPYDFFLKNIDYTGPRAKIYREEFAKADELMGWKKNWHPRGDKSNGPVKRGLGLSIHTWGGRGHASDCDLTVHPDGAVELKMGTQDLGTGTRTAILAVAADTLGLTVSDIKLLIGDSNYPVSGGSGGSTTIGGVSSSTRRAAVQAINQVFAKAAPALNAKPEELSAKDGKIFVTSAPDRSLAWKDACAKLGAMPITTRGRNPDKEHPPDLTNSGVGGVQMADVSVDTETGIVRVNKMVAVQDCGLVVSLTQAESQCLGALIMGITYALYEEKVMDPISGRMLNANMEHYRLAGIGDIGELVVHMMTGPGYDERGVIGLGEPPVISPGACISNAVANAIGVRVPEIPLTPDRVLAALAKGGA
ncbi:MAG: xanthine dehydrogenase family protein molybdopterin-binding subunit [Proteobacteria bacterium]|nr:MAG: xanthine dehydrogenase family protein molybdopterin-binding subunit [Pseudomonadota bacterium]